MILKNDTLYRKNLKERIQAKLAEKKLQKAQIKYFQSPRYDDVFFEGVKWLDSLAGESIHSSPKLRKRVMEETAEIMNSKLAEIAKGTGGGISQ